MNAPTQIAIQNLELCLLDSGLTLSVANFHVVQALSTPFEVTVVARAGADFSIEEAIGQRARFDVWAAPKSLLEDVEQEPIRWTGIVTAIEDVGGDEKGHRLFMVKIASKLWALSQNRNYRVFQQVTEIEIVTGILKEWNVPVELEIDPSRYKQRKYRVQYKESDLAFIQRNLEEVGVSYILKEVDGVETVVLCDEPQTEEARPALTYIDNAAEFAEGEWAREVRVTRNVKPGRYVIQDLDYRKPAERTLRVGAQTQSVSMLEQCLERFQYVPGAFLVESDAKETPVADDKGAARVDTRYAELVAKMRLEAKQAARHRITFETNALDIHPGAVVPITNHDRPELDVPVLVLATSFRGSDIGTWQLDCEGVPSNAPFRPLLKTPRPHAQGLESATVVGPKGQEIHTDEFGRVRVQFHWDRVGQYNDDSSCWIPVSQTWAGATFGSVHLPRVGQEVLIDFLGGDLDRPIVVGRVFTNLQRQPYALPDNKTITVVARTQTVGGTGYNEIMAEDAAGKQLLGFQAERDLKMLVKHDEHITVQNDSTKVVGHDMFETVGHDRVSSVQGVWKFDALPPPKTDKEKNKDGQTTSGNGGGGSGGNSGGGGGGGGGRSGMDWTHEALHMEVGTSKFDVKDGEITLTVGGSSIKITDALIAITTQTLTLDGSAKIDAHGGEILLNC